MVPFKKVHCLAISIYFLDVLYSTTIRARSAWATDSKLCGEISMI